MNSNNGTSCFFSCPEFYTQTSNMICIPCPQNCRRCTQSMQCLECLYNYVINSPDLITSSNFVNQTCIPNYCPPPYFSDSVQCQSCTSGCSVCQIDGRCLTCLSSYNLNSDLGTCYLNNCSVYQYYNSNANSCQSCASPCLTCISSSVCTSCISSLFLSQGSCLSACSVSYFAHKDSGSCRKCNPKC
jgi:proprotein convertase subtilisin/kexin type 5